MWLLLGSHMTVMPFLARYPVGFIDASNELKVGGNIMCYLQAHFDAR